jgi:hypothetical protein
MSTKTKTKTKTDRKGGWLVVEGVPGLTIAPASTPLTRLNYFDGKFLRASDLKLEQNAQRRLVHLSNLAGGFGIIHGFSTSLAEGDLLAVGPGQAIDGEGRVLLLPLDIEVSTTELIERSREQDRRGPEELGTPTDAGFEDCELAAAEPPDQVADGTGLWLITIAHAEFLCGDEDVYGKLCEQACVTSTERPYRIEGVVLRARRLGLSTTLPSSGAVALTGKHLRSRVASAYFADERRRGASLISGDGLRSRVWCCGAELAAAEVALGVLARQGASNLWFDAWTARRERMQTPPRMYWAHRMAMRPWREFLAQVLQFQCQLAELLGALGLDDRPLIDPCAEERRTLTGARMIVGTLIDQWTEAADEIADELRSMTLSSLQKLRQQLEDSGGGEVASGRQILIDGGIVELPPAGYLPVDPASAMTVNEQVRRLLGEGVDLRFCVVRPDDVARELEGAQHMDRISLLRGLDDPADKPPVDILVPDGEILEQGQAADGLSFRVRIAVGEVNPDFQQTWKQLVSNLDETLTQGPRFRGAARASRIPGGGAQAHIAATIDQGVTVDVDRLGSVTDSPQMEKRLEEIWKLPGGPGPGSPNNALAGGLWLDMSCSEDPLELAVGSSARVSFMVRTLVGSDLREYRIDGSIRILGHGDLRVGVGRHARRTSGRLTGSEAQTGFGGGLASSPKSKFRVEIIDLRPAGTEALVVSLTPTSDNALLDNDVVVAWDGESLDVSGLWAFRPLIDDPVPPQLVFSELEYDPDVLGEEDPDHTAALEGLVAIASAIEDPGFVTEALAKLFPSAPPSTTLELRAIHDWVLFHARHRKQCSLEPAPRPVDRPRYRVYTLGLATYPDVEVVAELLLNDDVSLGQYPLTEVGTVEYEPNTASLADPTGAITALWQPHGDGRELAWAGIVSVAGDGEALDHTRLLALEEVVETISPPLDEQESRRMSVVPRTAALDGADGVIVLLTTPREAMLRVSLYFSDERFIDELLEIEIPDATPSDEKFEWLVSATESELIGDFQLVNGQIVNEHLHSDSTLTLEVKRVIAYTRSTDDSPPEHDEVETAILEILASRDIQASRDQIEHRVFPYSWPSERGSVVVFVCEDVIG